MDSCKNGSFSKYGLRFELIGGAKMKGRKITHQINYIEYMIWRTIC
jgi:hypothetical protein